MYVLMLFELVLNIPQTALLVMYVIWILRVLEKICDFFFRWVVVSEGDPILGVRRCTIV